MFALVSSLSEALFPYVEVTVGQRIYFRLFDTYKILSEGQTAAFEFIFTDYEGFCVISTAFQVSHPYSDLYISAEDFDNQKTTCSLGFDRVSKSLSSNNSGAVYAII